MRRQELVPIPGAPTLSAIDAAQLARLDARLDTKTRHGRPDGDMAGQMIAVRFTEKRQFWAAPTPCAPKATTPATVSARALVRLDGAVYSVPVGRTRPRGAGRHALLLLLLNHVLGRGSGGHGGVDALQPLDDLIALAAPHHQELQ